MANSYREEIEQIRKRVADWANGVGEKEMNIDDLMRQVAVLSLLEGQRQQHEKAMKAIHEAEPVHGWADSKRGVNMALTKHRIYKILASLSPGEDGK